MRKLASLINIIDSISEWTGRVICYLIPIIVVEMIYEVVARYGFNAPTIWSYEVTYFLAGTAIIIGGAYTLLHRAHVNVDIVYARFSPRRRAILDVISSVLFFAFLVILVWKGGQFALKAVRFFEHSDSLWSPPLYHFKMMLPIGAGLLLLQGLANLIRNLIMAVTGREAQ